MTRLSLRVTRSIAVLFSNPDREVGLLATLGFIRPDHVGSPPGLRPRRAIITRQQLTIAMTETGVAAPTTLSLPDRTVAAMPRKEGM